MVVARTVTTRKTLFFWLVWNASLLPKKKKNQRADEQLVNARFQEGGKKVEGAILQAWTREEDGA
jgi:hypothetical protein